MKIRLKNGIELNCTNATGCVKYVKGVSRNCIAFSFNADEVSSDKLLELFKNNDATESVIVINDNSNEYEYIDYTIFNGISIIESTITVNMCQLTCYEKEEKERIEQLNTLSEVVADMLGGAL